ncbi:YczE/YyaS/YitT family protein, partial [Streptomyces sp. NRRL B-1347]|uniref:membrane protein YczE n=1 Tax=Streptomyces sp. NRRL B-1347 TaxID=1476877 RepID=UPI003B63F899
AGLGAGQRWKGRGAGPGAARDGARQQGPPRRTPPLTYLPFAEGPARRIPQLLVGLALYGFSVALTVRAALGVNPWAVLNQGLERHTPLSFGLLTTLVGAAVLALWIPLRQRPTFGTFANIALVGGAADAGLWLVPEPAGLPARIALLTAGILLNGLSIAVYVGARFGPGPRDGLMTGLTAATGRSLRTVRTAIEITVLATGWLLGGTVGPGTILYAVTVGPVAQHSLPSWTYAPRGTRK